MPFWPPIIEIRSSIRAIIFREFVEKFIWCMEKFDSEFDASLLIQADIPQATKTPYLSIEINHYRKALCFFDSTAAEKKNTASSSPDNLIKHLRRTQISHKNISAIIFAANKNQASSTSAYIRVSQEGRATISIDVLEYTH